MTPAQITDLADRIVAAANRALHLAELEVFISASIGVARAGDAQGDALKALRAADAAMYEAKRRGKNQWCDYLPTMDRQGEQLGLGHDLRRAIDNGDLHLAYQPIWDLQATRLIGFEALVRWAHPERGLLLPGEFLPVAEETGLIVPRETTGHRGPLGPGVLPGTAAERGGVHGPAPVTWLAERAKRRRPVGPCPPVFVLRTRV